MINNILEKNIDNFLDAHSFHSFFGAYIVDDMGALIERGDCEIDFSSMTSFAQSFECLKRASSINRKQKFRSLMKFALISVGCISILSLLFTFLYNFISASWINIFLSNFFLSILAGTVASILFRYFDLCFQITSSENRNYYNQSDLDNEAIVHLIHNRFDMFEEYYVFCREHFSEIISSDERTRFIEICHTIYKYLRDLAHFAPFIFLKEFLALNLNSDEYLVTIEIGDDFFNALFIMRPLLMDLEAVLLRNKRWRMHM